MRSHIFDGYTDFFKKEEVYVVEKDTKKAVKETINYLEEIQKRSGLFLTIDATVLKDIDKIKILVSYSLFHFRNLRARSLFVIKVLLNDEFDVELTEEDYKDFQRLKSRGGSAGDYVSVEEDLTRINKVINEKIDTVYNQMKEVNERYEEEISKVREKPLFTMRDFRRMFNFQSYQNTLKQLYDRCFNEMNVILQPELCTNPNPSFQRDLVWDLEKKQRLMYSIINEIPIGVFYVNHPTDYSKSLELCEGYGSLLWDGKQRIHAIHDFILNKFPIELEGKKVYYKDASGFFYYKIDNCRISVYESQFNTMEEIIEAYVTINKSLVKHTDEDLKKAEQLLKEYLKSKKVEVSK